MTARSTVQTARTSGTVVPTHTYTHTFTHARTASVLYLDFDLDLCLDLDLVCSVSERSVGLRPDCVQDGG